MAFILVSAFSDLNALCYKRSCIHYDYHPLKLSYTHCAGKPIATSVRRHEDGLRSRGWQAEI